MLCSSADGPSRPARLLPLGTRWLVAWNALAFAAAPALLLVLAYRRRWMTEDAFISLRVVRNLLAGHGPVFNMGERVEAYTHPLWVLVLSGVGALSLPLEATAVYLGLALSVAGLIGAQVAAWRVARRLFPGRDGVLPLRFVPAGALVFVAPSAVWDFATSGLESGLGFGWLGLGYLLVVRAALRPSPRRLPAATAGVLGLGPLVRPDLAPFALAFLVALWLSGGEEARRGFPPGDTATLALAAGLVPAGYQVFRMGYFASLVPNTALAKEAGAANWTQGVAYLRDLASVYRLWIPLVLLLPGLLWLGRRAWHRRDGRALLLLAAPVVAALLHALYVVRVGGDFMHGRLLLPGLLGVVLPMAVIPLPPWPARATLTGAALALGVAGWSLACAGWMRPPYGEEFSVAGLADERAYYTQRSGRRNPITLGDYLDLRDGWAGQGLRLGKQAAGGFRQLLAGDLVYPLAPTVHPDIALVAAVWNVGALGYAAGLSVHLVDRLGLADPIAARLRLDIRGRPGHEKALDDAWTIARYAAPGSGPPETPAVSAARAALRCGDLAVLRQAIETPLTAARFWVNLGLSGRLTRFRLSPDPEHARSELCRGH
jgi:arabinofuranosyltransferase